MNKKVILIKKRIKGLETIKVDNSHILQTNLKRSINYNYFIRLITYYTGVLFVLIGLTNLLNNLI